MLLHCYPHSLNEAQVILWRRHSLTYIYEHSAKIEFGLESVTNFPVVYKIEILCLLTVQVSLTGRSLILLLSLTKSQLPSDFHRKDGSPTLR